MTICPVCEHAQESGGECTVCGRRLLRDPPQGETVQPLADLEPTRIEAQPATAMEPMADLAPTQHDAIPEAETAEGSAPWLERTSLPPQAAPERDVFALPTCRYCRTPAGPGERTAGIALTPPYDRHSILPAIEWHPTVRTPASDRCRSPRP